MSLPILLDFVKPFDTFDPRNILKIDDTRRAVENFHQQWLSVLSLIPSLISFGDSYFNQWIELSHALASLSAITPLSKSIHELYASFEEHFDCQLFVLNDIKNWANSIQSELLKLQDERKSTETTYKNEEQQFTNAYSKCLKQSSKEGDHQELLQLKKTCQNATLSYGVELNNQTQQLTLLTEDNIVHLFNLYSKYVTNTVKRHFSEEQQIPKINNLIEEANSFRSSISIKRETFPIPDSLGGFLTHKDGTKNDKRAYYTFEEDFLVGRAIVNKSIQKVEQVNVLTTNFKANENMIECNGISGKQTFFTATKEEALEWCGLIEKQKENVLNGKQLTNRIVHPLLQRVLHKQGNNKCSECGCSNPQWISVNLGIIFCIKCSGIHRSLGVSFSRVKSTTLDNIEDYVVRILDSLGNDKVNSIYQQNYMLTEDSSLEERSEIISRKYVQKLFISNENEDWIQFAIDAVNNESIIDLMKALAHISIIDLFGKKLLLTAVKKRSSAIVSYLVINGYDLNEVDENGDSAIHIATRNGYLEIVVVLVRFKCDVAIRNNENQTPYELSQESGLIASLLRFSGSNDFDDLNEVINAIENHLSDISK
ncbi:Centaurin beta [Entamoeba marina]